MDDLDHSMHISDNDWFSFCEESEECCLLQASLACPDSSGLSDADDTDFTTQTYTPIKEHQTGEDSKELVVEEKGDAFVQCSSGVDSKAESDLKSEPEPVLKDALDCITWAEKEHLFVSVSDKPSQKLVSATVPVVKKKRKQNKICKVDCIHNDKVNYCDQVKLPQQKFSDTNTKSLEAVVSTASHKYSSDHLDIGNTSEPINAKCDINQIKSIDTILTQKICCKSAQIQQKTEMICIEVSIASDPRESKCDTCNEIIECVKKSDSVFIQEKDRNVSSESSQTQVAMDLTCLHKSCIDPLDISNLTKVKNSTCVEFDLTKQISGSKYIQEERFQMKVNAEIEDSSNEGKMQNILIKDTKIDASNNCDAINQTRNSDSGSLTCFGESCKEDSLNLIIGNGVEVGTDSGKCTYNSITCHTNSAESDEFADYESFSSSSYDSETYHSAAESVEDPRYLYMPNSPCNLSISINDYSSVGRGMHFTNGCLKQDGSQSVTETSQIFPLANYSVDNPPNDNSTCSTGADSTELCMSVDTPASADNPSTSLENQLECSPQLVTMESPEAYAKATGSSQPVYAISAFWDEMEKLTINDILHIRTGRCMLPIEEAIITNDKNTISRDNISTVNAVSLPETTILDTLDTADSDYCTNLESKPDRSSWDFSTSDFEEEYWQFINSSRNSSPDQHGKSYQSECTDYVCTSEESDEMGTPVPSEDCSMEKWSCDSTFNSYDLAMPQQMRKNKSMYDIHAPKSMEGLSSQAFLDMSSCKSLEKPLKMSDGFEVVTPVMCLTDEQYQISFPKVYEYLFDDNKAKCEVMSVSVYGLQGNYASPVNEYTFCTATNNLPIIPCIEEPIPIFSCSRPTVRELTFPKPGCIFSDLSSLYSVKKICFLDKGSDVWRSEAEKKPVCAIDSNVTVVGEGSVLSMTPKMFKEAAFGQISMEKNQMPCDSQSIFSTIKQSDMCLVCIAFASWVLRSSDPEAADAWKAALLANVSALSAIQYLRQFMKRKTSPQED
ncbi:uncharacterized protein perm1 isoform X2 [Boleophthalmus pectinirostris]|uniref:uncharacterized protein perm1 isoform X2 n=1 Tax=Boleophthalmus pectinirostris TaxID=150288 RepID=UPI00242BD749|nr:uncharacterized protein perm1 isoform X2 [Boleophthalmus pectinirostris]